MGNLETQPRPANVVCSVTRLARECYQRQGLFMSEEAIMTTAVTCATGFPGSALVTELMKCQQAVLLLVRNEK